MNTELIQRLKKCAEEFKSLLPVGNGNSLHVDYDGDFTVNIHGLADYKSACDVLRKLGFKSWDKAMFDPDQPWGRLLQIVDNIQINVFFAGLAPTCRIEEKEVKIPKSEYKETGEFITIKQKQIVCG